MRAAWYQASTMTGTNPFNVGPIPLNGARTVYLTLGCATNNVTSVVYKLTAQSQVVTESAVGTALGGITAGTPESVLIEANGAGAITLTVTPAGNGTFTTDLSST